MSFSLPHNLYQEYIAGQKYAKVQFVQENFDACISASNTLYHSLSNTNAELSNTNAELSNTNAKVDTLAQSSVYLGKIELSAIPASMLPLNGWYAMNGDRYPANSPVGERLLELAELDYMQEFLANCPIVEGSGNIALPNWSATIPDYVGAGGTSPGGVVMPFMRPVGGARQVGSVERDAIRNINGNIGRAVHGGNINNVSGAFYSQQVSPGGLTGAGTVAMEHVNMAVNRVIPTGPENTVTNRGMTPVIYLGV